MRLGAGPVLRERLACRICHSRDLRPVIDLGEQYLASVFVAGTVPPEVQSPYPLQLVRCGGECGLVQLRHTVRPDLLYRDYGYRSGTNELMRANLAGIARAAEEMVELRPGDVVVDVGCNDGTLLDSFRTEGLDRVGFDPACNVARLAAAKGVHVVEDFFSASAFARARPGRRAKVVTTIAMLYDLEDPMAFVRDVGMVLDPDGLWIIELSYLPTMLQRASFDTICHEHLEYYALRQLEWMLSRRGFLVHRVEFNEVNGGSFRLFVRRAAWGQPSPQDQERLCRIREEEGALGLDSEEPYRCFRERVWRIRDELRQLLHHLAQQGKRVYAYGASTKGNTILQFCGIDWRVVPKAADRNPDKWGRHTLGTRIPIVSEEEARRDNPDYFLVLPWHFLSSFVRREEAFLRRGGKFILPLPTVRMVGLEDLGEGEVA